MPTVKYTSLDSIKETCIGLSLSSYILFCSDRSCGGKKVSLSGQSREGRVQEEARGVVRTRQVRKTRKMMVINMNPAIGVLNLQSLSSTGKPWRMK